RPLEPAPARPDHRHGKRLDACAPTRAPAHGRAAPRHLRPRRLGRADAHDRGSEPRRKLDHPRPRGSPAALVPASPTPRPRPGPGRLRGRGRLMEAFAALVDTLVYTRGRNEKLR